MSRLKSILVLDLARGGGEQLLEAGGGAAGRVTTPTGGIGCRSGAAGAGGVEPTLCDRSRSEVWIGESLLSRAAVVGRVATMDCTVASWVVTVSSCLVMDASALIEG